MDEIGDAARAAALWSALNLLVMIVLSALVVRQRFSKRVAIGDGGVPEVTRATRAFGNAAEYVPGAVAAMALMAVLDAPAGWVHAVGAILLAGRLLHAVGISRSTGPSPPRFLGMVLTYAAYAVAVLSLLLHAL